MAFLNSAAADTVQLYSFPLEILGFALTSIEVLWPHIADRIENGFDRWVEIWVVHIMLPLKLALDMSGIRHEGRQSLKGDTRITSYEIFNTQLLILIFSIIGSIIYVIILRAYTTQIFVLMLIPLLCLTLVISLYSVNLTKIVNDLTHGKALGAIGLSMAFLGLLAEVYQVLTICFGTK
jgi:hypothetical protein